MSWLSDLFGSDKGTQSTAEQKTTYSQMPEYPEAEWARQEMGGKLKDWGSQPGYGAIPSNWNDLWSMAKNRTSQYFWGDAMGGGLAGKLRANTARQNMAGQPAEMRTLARMGAKEGDMLSDIAVKQAYAEAQESEQGRRNWMNDMYRMTGIKPTMQATSQSRTDTQKDLGGGEGWGLLGSLGSALLTGGMSPLLGGLAGGLGGLFGGGGGGGVTMPMFDNLTGAGYSPAPGRADIWGGVD